MASAVLGVIGAANCPMWSYNKQQHDANIIASYIFLHSNLLMAPYTVHCETNAEVVSWTAGEVKHVSIASITLIGGRFSSILLRSEDAPFSYMFNIQPHAVQYKVMMILTFQIWQDHQWDVISNESVNQTSVLVQSAYKRKSCITHICYIC